jgi:hypothetical protein
MEIGRRGLLVGVASLSLPKLSSPLGANFPVEERPTPTHQGWHSLTRSLLDRAGRGVQRTDRFLVERAIHEVTEPRSEHRQLVIKMAGNSDPCIRASEPIRPGRAGPDASREHLLRTSTFAEHGQRQS